LIRQPFIHNTQPKVLTFLIFLFLSNPHLEKVWAQKPNLEKGPKDNEAQKVSAYPTLIVFA